jgi:uncharacterized Zn finger protein
LKFRLLTLNLAYSFEIQSSLNSDKHERAWNNWWLQWESHICFFKTIALRRSKLLENPEERKYLVDVLVENEI